MAESLHSPHQALLSGSKLHDFVQLAKPRIALMVLFVVAVSGVISAGGQFPVWSIAHCLIGLLLISASGAALNQYLERHVDWLMPRTAQRPLPDHRLTATDVTVFGAITFGSGLAYLFMLVNWQTALVSALSWLVYVWIYTPLKRLSWLNTYVGAVAGAMPALVGSTAIEGHITIGAWLLFATIYIWQFPHFMAIAWLYRDDYSRGGLKMVSVGAQGGRQTALHAIVFAVLLVPTTVLGAWVVNPTNIVAVTITVFLGVLYLLASIKFARCQDDRTAKALFRVSLLHLPIYLIVLSVSSVA